MERYDPACQFGFYYLRIPYFLQCYEDLGIVFDALLNHIKSISILTFSVTMFETLLLAFDHTKFVDDDLVNSMKKATSLKVNSPFAKFL